MKSIVIYFSLDSGSAKKGSTRIVAEKIAEMKGANIARIEPEIKYPSDYDEVCKRAKYEIDENIHPQIKAMSMDFNEYDTVFIGFPIWYRTYPRPVASFIDGVDLTGKKVIPFCTNEEGAFGTADLELGTVVKAKGAKTEMGIAVKSFNAETCDNALKTWLSRVAR